MKNSISTGICISKPLPLYTIIFWKGIENHILRMMFPHILFGSHWGQSEEKEVEEKFQEGMLSKLSKITDLMSKLDVYVNGEDKDRVKKLLGCMLLYLCTIVC